jgi:DNA-binding protein Fis
MDNIINEYFYTVAAGHIYAHIINHIEKMVIVKALERSYGNQIAAAKLLGLHRNTLNSKIKKLNIDVGRFKR